MGSPPPRQRQQCHCKRMLTEHLLRSESVPSISISNYFIPTTLLPYLYFIDEIERERELSNLFTITQLINAGARSATQVVKLQDCFLNLYSSSAVLATACEVSKEAVPPPFHRAVGEVRSHPRPNASSVSWSQPRPLSHALSLDRAPDRKPPAPHPPPSPPRWSLELASIV